MPTTAGKSSPNKRKVKSDETADLGDKDLSAAPKKPKLADSKDKTEETTW
jgi:hypothetical protein